MTITDEKRREVADRLRAAHVADRPAKTFGEHNDQNAEFVMRLAEVFGAWQEWQRTKDGALPHMSLDRRHAIMDECADVVHAVCNLVDAFGEYEFDVYMEECA